MSTLPLRRELGRVSALHSLSAWGYVWRTLFVAISYVLLQMIIAQAGAQWLQVTMPRTGIEPNVAVLSMLLAGFLIVPAIGPLSLQWRLPLGQRVFLMFLLTCTFAYLIGAPEVLLFTTYALSFQVYLIVLNIGVWLGVAILVGLLFQPAQTDRHLWTEIRKYFRQRSASDWARRIAVASLLFFPIYFFFGFVFSPLTGPYYNQMANGLGLVIPPFQVMIPVEVVRGLWYALTTIPLLAILKMSQWRTALWVGIVLAVFGAIMPQIVNVAWPVPLRLGHRIEMVFDSLAQGAMLAWLLWVNDSRDRVEALKGG